MKRVKKIGFIFLAAVISLSCTTKIESYVFASGSDDGTIKVWDMNDLNKEPKTLAGYEGGVLSIAFSLDGKLLAVGGKKISGILNVTNLKNPEELVELYSGADSVAFGPKSQLLALGGSRIMRILDVTNQKKKPEELVNLRLDADSVAFSPNGKLLASGFFPGIITIWDVRDPKKIKKLKTVGDGKPVKFMDSIAFSPNGNLLASGFGSTIKILDVSNSHDINELKSLKGHGARDLVLSVAFSPNGKLLASGSRDSTIKVWDMSDLNKKPKILEGHKDEVRSVAFSSDSKRLVSGSKDKTIKLWDVTNSKNIKDEALKTLRGHEGSVTSVAFRP